MGYITAIDINNSTAESRQISCMVDAFKSNSLIEFAFIDQNELNLPKIIGGLPRSIRGILVAVLGLMIRNPELVFCRELSIAIVGTLFGKYVIYEVHQVPKSALQRWVIRAISNFNKFQILSISEGLAKKYQHSNLNVALVCHDGAFFDLDSFTGRVRKHKIAWGPGRVNGVCQVVHTGSLYKGGVSACAYLINECAVHVHLVGVKTYNEEAQLQSLIKSNRKGDYSIIPWVTQADIQNYFDIADLLLYITDEGNPLYEVTSPLKVFEYLASGKPILAAVGGSVSEVLNGENAYVFPAASPREIITAFEQAEKTRMKPKVDKDAFLKLMKDYDWRQRVLKILNHLQKMKNNGS